MHAVERGAEPAGTKRSAERGPNKEAGEAIKAPRQGRSGEAIKAPRQGRSRDALKRIVQATEALLDGRDFESVSVQEICKAADVSASSFYARFESKEALLFHLHARHRAERVKQILRHSHEIEWDALSLQEYVRVCIAIYVDDRRKRDPYLRSIMLAELSHPEIREERAKVDQMAVKTIRDYLVERIDSTDPALPLRIEFGIRTVAYTVQEAIAPPQRFAESMGLSKKGLVDELAMLFLRYVGLAPTPTGVRARTPAQIDALRDR